MTREAEVGWMPPQPRNARNDWGPRGDKRKGWNTAAPEPLEAVGVLLVS